MIGPKAKKLWLSIIPARRPSEQPGMGPAQKGVNCNFFIQNSTSHTALESSRFRTLKYAFSAGLAKRQKNYSSFNFWADNLEKFQCEVPLFFGAPPQPTRCWKALD